MTEQAWLEWRRGGIGASEAPAILGVCEHRTRLAVYLDKIGRSHPRPRTEEQAMGLRMEAAIAEAYGERTGHPIVEQQRCAESEVHPWMRATIDGIRDDGRIVEFKALGLYQANNWKAPDGDWQALPQNFIVQVHHQMVVMDLDVADVAVLMGLKLRTYTVPRSEHLANLIVDLTGELWECVVDRVPPRTVDARDHERIEHAYPRAEGDSVLDDPSLVEAAEAWFLRKDKAAKVVILDAMGEAATAVLADGRRLVRKERHVKGYTVEPKVQITLEVE